MMTEDSPAHASPEPAPEQEAAGPHWWQRLLPVSIIAATVLALAALAFPGVDEDEVALSTSRKPKPFVELYLAGRPAALCAGDSPQVRFHIESHLQRVRRLAYRIRVNPAGPRGGAVPARGKTRIAPGQGKSVRTKMAAPVGTAYDITVRLRDRPERLRIHCHGTLR